MAEPPTIGLQRLRKPRVGFGTGVLRLAACLSGRQRTGMPLLIPGMGIAEPPLFAHELGVLPSLT
jgi:hypothetical protein